MEAQLVNAKTKIYAILGDPISHSMSPVIMNASFRRFGMDRVFLALRCGKENAGCVMKALRCVDLAGKNHPEGVCDGNGGICQGGGDSGGSAGGI